MSDRRPAMLEQFGNLREKNMLAVKEAKEKGKKVIGTYCTFAPQELILAAGAYPVTLCATKQEPIGEAEKVLPRNLCPLIKSSFGFAISDTCPYFHFADLIIAETTCDGKKKMFELMAKFKPLHMMELPQGQGNKDSKLLWVKEVEKTKKHLEEFLKVEISEEALKNAIELMNRERSVLKEVHELNKIKPAPLTGLEMLMVLWMKGFMIDKEEGIDMAEKLISEVKGLVEQGVYPVGEEAPRILLTGVPVGLGSEKVITLLEEAGASVVVLENCTGYKPLHTNVQNHGEITSLEAIAEKYLGMPCSCMSPNEARFELIGQMVEDYQVDGVVDLTWIGCHTYNIESYSLKEYLKEMKGIPFIQVETDYSSSDIEQLKVRLEAFLELLHK